MKTLQQRIKHDHQCLLRLPEFVWGRQGLLGQGTEEVKRVEDILLTVLECFDEHCSRDLLPPNGPVTHADKREYTALYYFRESIYEFARFLPRGQEIVDTWKHSRYRDKTGYHWFNRARIAWFQKTPKYRAANREVKARKRQDPEFRQAERDRARANYTARNERRRLAYAERRALSDVRYDSLIDQAAE